MSITLRQDSSVKQQHAIPTLFKRDSTSPKNVYEGSSKLLNSSGKLTDLTYEESKGTFADKRHQRDV